MSWEVPESEVEMRFTPSGGPGGQHANRSHTRVVATFDVTASPTIPADLRRRVIERIGSVVQVSVDDERSQYRNRQIALERLRARVASVGRRPRTRRPTRPTKGSQRRRVEAKRRRGDVKRGRRRPGPED